jgi:hypothetical protein
LQINALGMQDSSRKHQPPLDHPKAWAGSIVMVENGEEIVNHDTVEKWQKGQVILNALCDDACSSPDGCINVNCLLSDRGFLVHLAGAFKCMVPYWKGLHLMANFW